MSSGSLDNLKVLVVEDDDDVAAVIKAVLQMKYASWSIFRARNGHEALSVLSHASGRTPGFDLIVSDWVLPGASGFDLLKHVRGTPATASTPFLIVTGCGYESMMPLAEAAGVSAFLAKPFSEEELLAEVERAFTRHRTLLPSAG